MGSVRERRGGRRRGGEARARQKLVTRMEASRKRMVGEDRNGLHVAIIMDGNGRWATRQGLPRVAGHRAGVMAARRVVEHASEAGVRCLTLYAFSSDNWRRPAAEVEAVFWLLRAFLRLQTARLRDRGVRFEAIGRRDRVPAAALGAIEKAEAATAGGRGLHLRVAIDYSARNAIARAACEAGGRKRADTGRRDPASDDRCLDRRLRRRGFADSHRRRKAVVGLSAMGVRLCGTDVHGADVAGVR